MSFDGGGDGADRLHRFSRHGGIGNFESVGFVQGNDQLQGVHGIQTQAAGAEEGLVVADLVWSDLEHEILDQHAFDLRFE